MGRFEPAWPVFVTELQKHLEDRGMSSAGLAHHLGGEVDEETVANWRRGRTRPRLAQLQRIAEVLGMGGKGVGNYDPLYLLRRMGMLPEEPAGQDLVEAAYRLQKLELKLHEAMALTAEMGQQAGAATIVRAATTSCTWAVAVWPATEGPSDCRLHVADRVDIRRCDGKPTTTDEVWQDRELKTALRAAYAIPATREPRWSPREDATVSHWSISHLGAPMSPAVGAPHGRIWSLSFTALTVSSWVNDVASLTATVLGYGLTTTRDLAMEIFGLHLGATTAEQRTVVHDNLLKRPPARRAWSHHAQLPEPGRDVFTVPGYLWRDDLVHVCLRESDEVLEDWFHPQRPGTEGVTLAELIADRAAIDDRIPRLPNPNQVIILDVAHFEDPDRRWQQVLQGVKTTLDTLVERGLLDADLTALHHHIEHADRHISRPLLRWLRDHGCLATR